MTNDVTIIFDSREFLELARAAPHTVMAYQKLCSIVQALRSDLIADNEVLNAAGRTVYHDLRRGGLPI